MKKDKKRTSEYSIGLVLFGIIIIGLVLLVIRGLYNQFGIYVTLAFLILLLK